MRHLSIPSSRAAYDRLKLMRDPDALAVPFDQTKIEPFGLKVFDKSNEKNAIRLTYRGKNIGAVRSHNTDSFVLELAIPPSEKVDTFIHRTFSIITAHLDLVARTLAQEKKNKDPQTPQEKRTRAQERAEAIAEMKRQEREDRLAQKLAEEQKRCAGFDLPQGAPVNRHLEGFSAYDVHIASQISAPDDPLSVHEHAVLYTGIMGFAISTRRGKRWTFNHDEGNVFLLANDDYEMCKPDVAKVAAAMRALVTRNAKIVDPERMKAIIAAIPAAAHSVHMYAVADDVDPPVPFSDSISTDQFAEGATFEVDAGAIALRVDGVTVAMWTINTGPTGIHDTVHLKKSQVLEPEDFQTDEIVAKVGSIWMSHCLPAIGLDPKAYPVLDPNEMEDDMLTVNLGYTF